MSVKDVLRTFAVAMIATQLCISVSCRLASGATVDNSTLNGKMIMGYQGWFNCPGDAAGRGWVHWKSNQKNATIDMLPDVSELGQSELCDSGWVARSGKPVELFSSQNPKTVDRHFAWMENYGLDGVALQKFATSLLYPELAKSMDKVLENVRAGARNHGRVYFLMYDLSGMPPDKLSLVVQDWQRLIGEGVTSDRGYLRHKGRPVLGLWGIGLAGRPLTPQDTEAFLSQIRSASDSVGGLTILGGVPTVWAESGGDGGVDPGWAKIWPKLDVISPWTVGSYVDDAGADRYRDKRLVPDLARAKELGVDYMPVVFPGFSWSNLMNAAQNPSKAIFNQIPRRCGAFYRRQVTNAVQSGAGMIYTAMFDEVDEGTAMFKIAPDSFDSPASPAFVTLDADGCHPAADMYLKLASEATKNLAKRKDDLGNTSPPSTPDRK